MHLFDLPTTCFFLTLDRFSLLITPLLYKKIYTYIEKKHLLLEKSKKLFILLKSQCKIREKMYVFVSSLGWSENEENVYHFDSREIFIPVS